KGALGDQLMEQINQWKRRITFGYPQFASNDALALYTGYPSDMAATIRHAWHTDLARISLFARGLQGEGRVYDVGMGVLEMATGALGRGGRQISILNESVGLTNSLEDARAGASTAYGIVSC